MRKLSLFRARPTLFALLSSGVFLAACGGSQPPPEPPPVAPPPPPAATAAPPPAPPAPPPAAAVEAPPPEAAKPHMGHHGMEELFVSSLDSLELTAEQKAPVDAIKGDFAKHGEVAKEPREKLAADVSDGVAAGKIDHAKTDADIRAMSAAVAAGQPAMQDDMNRLYKVLTPEQRKKLIETLREKGKEMHEHDGMAHGGMAHDGMAHDGMAPHEHENKGPGHMDHEHGGPGMGGPGMGGPGMGGPGMGGPGMGGPGMGGPGMGGPGMGEDGMLSKLSEELGLTPEQKDKLRVKLDAQMKTQHATMKDKMTAGMKHMDAVGTAFEGDKFDAKKAGVGSEAPDMVKTIATAKVQFVETVLSVLTPEQRPKFVAQLKEHEAEMN